MCNELVVPAEEDFGHHVALIAKVFEVLLGAQIVETIGFPVFTAGKPAIRDM
jgi:hypothetical protein